jgi:hypothetical protein
MRRRRAGILLQMPAAAFTIPFTILASSVSIGNLRGISSWRPRRVAEAGWRWTLGGVIRI